MREQPIGAPSGPTNFALGPALTGRVPVRLSRKRPGTFIKKILAEATGRAPDGALADADSGPTNRPDGGGAESPRSPCVDRRDGQVCLLCQCLTKSACATAAIQLEYRAEIVGS
ncbi:hypothetical protein PoB_005351800 [Plakobranchus ocellatus]|uniref:Uncharacterized protein n=1 Tax=Plakobranchus ocellatus TaxID=259542 RepID=A0AAV4C7N6_9GAST|nr:hypothetical protein PoB_005351800 [Plakobranchus ocellatus]